MNLEKIENFQDAVVTVMGLGRFKQGSGMGAAKWLMRHGAQIVITDLKTQEELRESVEDVTNWYTEYRKQYPDRTIYPPIFVLGEHHESDFTDVDLVVQNPGVPRESEFVKLARDHGVLIESDVSLFFRYCPFPIIAITGTRGKSTTTAWIGHMLKRAHPKTVIAGNIQRSPLEDLDQLLEEKKPVPVVLELSSWLIESLENISRAPDIAVLTNVFPDHLNRYASFEAYAQSKESLFKRQTPEQKMVVNADQDLASAIGSRAPGARYWFSESPLEGKDGVFVDNGMIALAIGSDRQALLSAADVGLKGRHNLQNALATALTAYLAGVPSDAIADSLKTFTGLPSRQELIKEVRGVAYVNDTTATSPDGAIAALDRFGEGGRVVLLAGGASKDLPFEELGKKIRATCKYVVLFEGTATNALEAAIGDNVPSVRVDSMKKAIEAASAVAQSGDTVLLSPGTASFGIFKNEFDRGDQFVEAVKSIKE